MKRKYIIFAFALAALVGSLVTAFATIEERNYTLRGYVDATQDDNLPYRVPLLGVNAELTQYDDEELVNQLDRMQDAHITWIRQIFSWDEIEPQAGEFEWEKWDGIIDTVNAYPNFRFVAVLVNTPSWARTPQAPDNPTAPTDDPAYFANFARAFAERYGQEIDYYQIWDEPNLQDAWGGLNPRPAQYAAMLQGAYRAIHEVDVSATVIAAALAPTVETGPDNISDILYLRDLYAHGAKDYMDAVAGKPFGFDYPPTDRTVDSNVLNFSHIIALREEMVRNGDGKKALWASAWGWNSLPDDWAGTPSIWGAVNSDERSRYTLEAINRAEREWPWLGGMVLFHWQPDAVPDDPLWGFAIIDQQNNPSTLWAALSQRPQPAAAQNGLFHPITPYARYSGVWTFGDPGADIGWIEDSQLEFDFHGRDITLLLRQNNYVAYLYPTIAGQQANATPHDTAGNAYIILTSNSLEPEIGLVPVARGLDNIQHTLRIITDELVPDEVEDRWALAGYAVSSGNLATPYNNQLTVAWLTVAVAGIAVIVSGWNINWSALSRPARNLWQRLNNTGQIIFSAITSLALMVGMFLTWSDATPNIFRSDPVQLVLAVVTAGLIYIEPPFVLTVVALIVLFIIIYNRIELGLMLTIFWAPFFMFPVELYSFAFPMAEILILVTGAAWFLGMLSKWEQLRRGEGEQNTLSILSNLHAIDYGIIAWLTVGVVSLAWTEQLPEAITELRAMMVEPALFYLILRTSSSNRKSVVRLIDALLFAGFAVAGVGLVMYVQGVPGTGIITAEGGAWRLASVYGSPNNVGLFLGRCIPFALAYAIIQTDKTRRIFAAIVLAVMGLAVVLSQSVGALLIGIPAAIIAVVLLAWGRRAWPVLAGLGGISAIVFTIALQSSTRFASLLDFSQGTNFYRLRVWESAVNIIRDHPLTGVGLDQFLYVFRGQYILPDAWQEPNLSHPHNFILDFWVRLGILGVLIFLWLQLAFWRTARRVYSHQHNPLLLAATIGVIGSMVNLLAHGLTDNSVYVVDLSYVFVLLLGLIVNLSNIGAIDEDAYK